MTEAPELDEIRAKLAAHRAELDRFHVRSVSVFGSRARGDARPDSDIDLIVEFSKPVGFIHFFKVEEYLAQLLGRKIDMTTPGGLHPRLKDAILKDARKVA
jgi:predicted nucleotidyltransferase